MQAAPVVSSSRRWSGLAWALIGLAACSGGSDDGDGVVADPDAAAAAVDAPAVDGAIAIDAAMIDAGVPIDAPPPMGNFATYRIAVGAHSATVSGGGTNNPIAGFTQVDARDFQFAFNASAAYVLTMPTEPTDQLDWNKLPGLSDCGQLDLSVNGAMFGWRWRLDLNPKVLEVTAYANNNSTHLTPAQPLFTLTMAELMADAPLRYRVWWQGNQYRFAVTGMIGARAINATTMISRICPNQGAGSFKWAGGFYFGGTSTAPSVITGRVLEIPFVP